MAGLRRRLKRKHHKVKFYRIHSDVGCIPAGVYRLDNIDECVHHFNVGKGISFLVGTTDKRIFYPLSLEAGAKMQTKPEDFVENYYSLLEKNSGISSNFNPSAPITMCFMPSDFAYEVN